MDERPRSSSFFLESHKLAHEDLRLENILLDRNRLKLSDFDCTADIGTNFEACIPPYRRILNSNETDQGRRGSSGLLSPRTEQFAIGSLFYYINYGFEVYGDRYLTPEDPKEHGPKVVDLLQNMEFPTLDCGDALIDDIIDKCWHNKYALVKELAAHREMLLAEETNGEEASAEPISTTGWRTVAGHIIRELWCSLGVWRVLVRQSTDGEATNAEEANGRQPNRMSCDGADQEEDSASKKAFCQDLEKRGLLDLLSSDEPEQLGFSFELYRHSC